MPNIHADASLYASCGSANPADQVEPRASFIHIAFDMDTFEVTDGISLAKTAGPDTSHLSQLNLRGFVEFCTL